MITALLISAIVVGILIVMYRSMTGIWPGARLVIEDAPVTATGISDGEAKFMFFYTDWCPFCVKAKSQWSSFKQMMKNNPKTYGGKTIYFEEVNCDTQVGRAALYKIDSYPTFKLQTKEKVYRMTGKPTVDSFRSFLKSALGNES